MKGKNDFLAKYGPWFFVGGVFLALILGVFNLSLNIAVPVLVLLGLLVGATNVTSKETTLFLVASIAFLMTSGSLAPLLGQLAGYGTLLQSALNYMAMFVAPATFVVALKALYELSRD